MSEQLKMWLLAIWLGVGAIVAIATWLDNGTVQYVHGDPPSPLWNGALWPALVVAFLIFWIIERREGPHP